MLTPLDIQNITFKTAMNGYHKKEVDDFLMVVMGDYENLYKTNIDLKDRVGTMADAVNHYKSIEGTMQSAILVAQSTGDEVVKNAHKTAENIIAEAKIKSDRMIADAEMQIAALEKKYTEFRNLFESHKIRQASMLKMQLDILENVPADNEKLTRSEMY